MSVFSSSALSRSSLLGQRLFCRQAPRIQTLPLSASRHQRNIVTLVGPADLLPGCSLNFPKLASRWSIPRLSFPSPTSVSVPSSNGATAITSATTTSTTTIGESLVGGLQSLLRDLSTWFIKRTFQPSLVKKRRKHGFLRRQESVGGRRVLKRRMAKGRARLGGS